jgi:hypothetical protein
MKSIAAGNPHIRNAAARTAAIERNVASSSAIEGVSRKVFLIAAKARLQTHAARTAGLVPDRRPTHSD